MCALFAMGMTLAVLQFSFRHGRLITVPTYDDVGYFADAADRLTNFYRDGFPGLWHTYWINPPHSPYSTGMAVAAFGLFGMRDWAPYVMNSLIVLGYFLMADWLLRGVGRWTKLVCFALLATLPFVGMAVHEFRPDFAVALFTAAGVMMLLSGHFVYGPARRKICAGVWLGIAMLTKPPVFPQTLALGGAAIFLATLSDWVGSGHRPKVGAVARAWLMVLLPFLLIPLPHYIHNRHNIIEYIISILRGKYEQSYTYAGTPTQHALYFLTGPGGQIMLGTMPFVLLSMLGGGIVALFAIGTRRDRVRALAMVGIIAAAWLIPTVNKTKSEYFGLAFDTLLAFSVLFVAGRVILSERIIRWPKSWPDFRLNAATWAVAALVVLGTWRFQWPVRNGNVYAAWEQQRNDFIVGIFDRIVSHCDFYKLDVAPTPDPTVPADQIVHARRPRVVFCCRGDFNDDILKYLALQKQITLTSSVVGDSLDPADTIKLFPGADFIFCSEPGNQLMSTNLPISAIAQPLLDAARARSEFEQIGKWTYMKGTQSEYLFARRDWTGFTPVSGFGEIEGPYPNFDMHNVRWGLGPASTITVTADRDGIYDFYWCCRSGFPGQVVSVKRDGQFIGKQNVVHSNKDMGENRFPMMLKAGTHTIEFDYAKWYTDPGVRPMAVLFQHFNVARRKE
jgi:4-amino-4-deoxy-L-arabinose transferase-like glycosyltransferase